VKDIREHLKEAKREEKKRKIRKKAWRYLLFRHGKAV